MYRNLEGEEFKRACEVVHEGICSTEVREVRLNEEILTLIVQETLFLRMGWAHLCYSCPISEQDLMYIRSGKQLKVIPQGRFSQGRFSQGRFSKRRKSKMEGR